MPCDEKRVFLCSNKQNVGPPWGGGVTANKRRLWLRRGHSVRAAWLLFTGPCLHLLCLALLSLAPCTQAVPSSGPGSGAQKVLQAAAAAGEPEEGDPGQSQRQLASLANRWKMTASLAG